MTEQSRAREWTACITGSHTGALDNRPNSFPRARPGVEVIRVREVLAEDVAVPAMSAPVAPAAAPVETVPAAPQVDVAAACAEAVEAALTELARELGCFFSTDIPGNAGLFVPGTPRAQENARAAILALFDHVRQGGLMMRPLSPDTLKALGLQKIPAVAAPAPAPATKAAHVEPQAEAPAVEQSELF